MAIKIASHSISPSKAKTAGRKENFLNRDIQLFNSFGDKKKERFYMDLRILLMAGIDLKTALELIIEEQAKAKDKTFYTAIYDDVIKGKSLASSLMKSGKFSEYECYSIEIGEESNRLNEVLDELMKYYAQQAALKKQIVSVLSYPAFVFVITIGLVYFMLTSVVPMFADVFKQFGSELPPLTLKVIYLSENFPFYALVFFILSAAIGGFMYWQKDQEWYRKNTSVILMRIPKIGELIRLVYLSRFTQAMHLLLASRTPLVRSLELSERMIRFYPLQKAISHMRTEITLGKSLHSGMSDHTIFPKRMLSLIKVGEEVNQLDLMMAKLSAQYNEELKYQTGIIGKIMEPMILLIIGCIVGLILVAMYMPMFNLSNLMAQ